MVHLYHSRLFFHNQRLVSAVHFRPGGAQWYRVRLDPDGMIASGKNMVSSDMENFHQFVRLDLSELLHLHQKQPKKSSISQVNHGFFHVRLAPHCPLAPPRPGGPVRRRVELTAEGSEGSASGPRRAFRWFLTSLRMVYGRYILVGGLEHFLFSIIYGLEHFSFIFTNRN